MNGFLNFAGFLTGPARHGDRLRVLVAEDHADISRLFTWMLNHFGFEAVAVLDGRQVHPTARSFRPHFILLDIGLPGLDGYQIAELIRNDADLNHVVIIGISAYSRDMEVGHDRQSYFDHYFTKPVDIQSILPLLVPRRN